MKKKTKNWYDYLWIVSIVYFILGAFNILFAWLGMICFLVPIFITLSGNGKLYCNSYCGRGQLFSLLGDSKKLSRYKPTPRLLTSKYFRYGFLIFFMAMFASVILNTVLVLKGSNDLKSFITILWTFKLPWHIPQINGVSDWMLQFGFGFYSLMLTSSLIGFIMMYLYKPRTWCSFCPMGTMTQELSKIMYRKK